MRSTPAPFDLVCRPLGIREGDRSDRRGRARGARSLLQCAVLRCRPYRGRSRSVRRHAPLRALARRAAQQAALRTRRVLPRHRRDALRRRLHNLSESYRALGYVDVEYAWHGCPTIGNLVGGLGKVPGVYYQILEPGDHRHVLGQLLRAIDVALSMDAPTLVAAVRAGLDTSFPIEPWASALDDQYRQVLAFAEPMRARAAAAAELSRRLSAMGSTARSLVGSSRALLGSTAPPGLGTQRVAVPGEADSPITLGLMAPRPRSSLPRTRTREWGSRRDERPPPSPRGDAPGELRTSESTVPRRSATAGAAPDTPKSRPCQSCPSSVAARSRARAVRSARRHPWSRCQRRRSPSPSPSGSPVVPREVIVDEGRRPLSSGSHQVLVRVATADGRAAVPRRQTGPPSGSLNAAALAQSLPSHLSPALFEGEIGVAIGHRRRLSSKGSVLSDGSSPASLALSLPPQPSPVRPPLTAPARPPLGARFGSTRTSVTLSVTPPLSDERRPPSAQRPGRRMSPMSPNQPSRRMSPGPLSRNRNMSVLATLPTPNMKRKLVPSTRSSTPRSSPTTSRRTRCRPPSSATSGAATASSSTRSSSRRTSRREKV